jgi:predicted CoA-substrate-specific enzyme activase
MQKIYIGIDVGSVSTNLVAMNGNKNVVESLYIRTQGNPIQSIKNVLQIMKSKINESEVAGVGVTGSGRHLAGIITGADVIKNEITAHGVAALHFVPEVKTIIEIGGQDSKLILIQNGIIYDFAMNTICAAGTGSFIDRQAERLAIPIEKFGEIALESQTNVRIAGRCAVFAESDMIHKQQMGHNTEDIVNGLCEALVRNYINNLAKGKKLESPIVMQGGVSLNIGIVKAFERVLECKIEVPQYASTMGAYGAAILARKETRKKGYTNFVGFDEIECDYEVKSFECDVCANACEVIDFYKDSERIAMFNDRCGRYTNSILKIKMAHTI